MSEDMMYGSFSKITGLTTLAQLTNLYQKIGTFVMVGVMALSIPKLRDYAGKPSK